MSYDAVTLIRKKRDRESLSAPELDWLVQSYTRGEVPDYQMSAFLMAGLLNGFDKQEAADLTHSMLHSGQVLDLRDIPGIKVDKHSTGGVGDKTSLLLAPIVAACGVPVPMISGRGLGHTGGTLDKLESIPGFSIHADLPRYREILSRQGAVLIGQTPEIAPADRKLYALRDVTATVESIPLIAGSIMSKKLAEGIDALVLDVKSGSGAFMRTEEQALELAQTLVGIGESFGKRTVAYLTDMNQPLGRAVGNWLEVLECMECLKGGGPDDLLVLTHLLAGTMIHLGGRAGDVAEGIEMSRACVASGRALEKWLDMVREQGGDAEPLLHPERYPFSAAHTFEVRAERDGYLTDMDTFELGMAAVALGAGRRVKEDPVDPGAGFVMNVRCGDRVAAGETLCVLHSNKGDVLQPAADRLRQAIRISDSPPVSTPGLVRHVVDRDGVRPYAESGI